MKRTHNNGELSLANAGEHVTVVGWGARRRNLGSGGLRLGTENPG